MFADVLVGWKSRKQSSIATSTSEAEFAALSELCSEIIWYKQLVKDLRIEVNQAIMVFEDNTMCIQMATTDKMRSRSKHIDIKYHNVREAIKEKLIELQYCESEKNLADILRKPLNIQKHIEITEKLGICSAQTLNLEGCQGKLQA